MCSAVRASWNPPVSDKQPILTNSCTIVQGHPSGKKTSAVAVLRIDVYPSDAKVTIIFTHFAQMIQEQQNYFNHIFASLTSKKLTSKKMMRSILDYNIKFYQHPTKATRNHYVKYDKTQGYQFPSVQKVAFSFCRTSDKMLIDDSGKVNLTADKEQEESLSIEERVLANYIQQQMIPIYFPQAPSKT